MMVKLAGLQRLKAGNMNFITTNLTNNTKKACALCIRSLRLLRCEMNNYRQGWF